MSLEAKIGASIDLRYLICEKHIAFYRVDGDVISVADLLTADKISFQRSQKLANTAAVFQDNLFIWLASWSRR